MGLLTDPSAGQGKISKALIRYQNYLALLLYIAGVVWFCALAHMPVNQSTYFSENALLPGLVKSEFREDNLARRYYDELVDEMNNYKDSIPYPWLLAKFRQIGLDTYTHNFTLNYPLGKQQKFTGKNVYGILRAARASSTESLVMSVPYRPPSSVHPPTAPSIAIMLAFAKFANKEKYWAKDIIFLITEHEQLGAQAWLEAYHGVQCGTEGILDHGDLRGRAGAIQAAINLELHDVNIAQVDIKIEGLNGQLPNLDLFNLAAKMCMKEGVTHTFKNRLSKLYRHAIRDWKYSFRTLVAMVLTQSTGIPTGNHGLFHRFGIEALTLEGSPTFSHRNSKASFLIMGRILEGVFRSLNNLLERFHQSYFFYLLPSSERFISIGLYMPSVSLIATALFIRSCAKWCKLQEKPVGQDKDKKDSAEIDDDEEEEFSEPQTDEEKATFMERMHRKYEVELLTYYDEDKSGRVNLIQIITIFIFAHFLGILILNSPPLLTRIGNFLGFKTDVSLYYSMVGMSVLMLFSPYFVKFKNCEKSMAILNIFALLEFATAIVCISMNNFSLAVFCSVIYVPLMLLITQTNCRIHLFIQKLLWLLFHPLILLNVVVAIYTFTQFTTEPFMENVSRSLVATQQALVFAVVDSLIYGNWLFSVVCSIFVSNWVCFWFVSFSRPQEPESVTSSQEKKTN